MLSDDAVEVYFAPSFAPFQVPSSIKFKRFLWPSGPGGIYLSPKVIRNTFSQLIKELLNTKFRIIQSPSLSMSGLKSTSCVRMVFNMIYVFNFCHCL